MIVTTICTRTQSVERNDNMNNVRTYESVADYDYFAQNQVPHVLTTNV